MNSGGPASNQHKKSGELATEPVAHFEIYCHRCIGDNGVVVGELPEFAKDRETMMGLYRDMVLTRSFDETAVSLQRTGRLGTYPSSLGEEAVSVGVASAMKPHDVFLPSFREHGGQLARGVTLTELLLYWGGDERGNDFSVPRQDFPNCVPVASHFPHAAGVGLALKLGSSDGVAVCIAGDGATSKGEFHEAMNIAGVWGLPVLFVIANNQWAISVPRDAQTRSATLAQKAIAAGIGCEQVDGNDIVAVKFAAKTALDRIRNSSEPFLMEALTYRLGDHTTADDASRYREDEEVSQQWAHEPIARLRHFLMDQGWWTSDDERRLNQEIHAKLDAAVEEYLSIEAEPPETIFQYLFADSTGLTGGADIESGLSSDADR